MSNKAGIYLCFPIFFSIASGTLIKPNRHSIGYIYETPLMSPSAFGFFTSSEILLLFSNASTTLLQARLLLFSLRSISSSLLYSPFLPTFNLYRNGNPVAVLNCPFAYVLFVEFYDFFEVCDVASSAYLPHSGKSRLGCEAGTVMKFVFIPFVYCWRAGSD